MADYFDIPVYQSSPQTMGTKTTKKTPFAGTRMSGIPVGTSGTLAGQTPSEYVTGNTFKGMSFGSGGMTSPTNTDMGSGQTPYANVRDTRSLVDQMMGDMPEFETVSAPEYETFEVTPYTAPEYDPNAYGRYAQSIIQPATMNLERQLTTALSSADSVDNAWGKSNLIANALGAYGGGVGNIQSSANQAAGQMAQADYARKEDAARAEWQSQQEVEAQNVQNRNQKLREDYLNKKAAADEAYKQALARKQLELQMMQGLSGSPQF